MHALLTGLGLILAGATAAYAVLAAMAVVIAAARWRRPASYAAAGPARGHGTQTAVR